MTKHRIVWEIDLEEDTPEEAAIVAYDMMLDPTSIATVFTVTSDNGDKTVIDMEGKKPTVIKRDIYKKCAGCGTTENLHRDYGSGGPWRCDSPDCMVY